jgi:PAS domain S-box-containing protein
VDFVMPSLHQVGDAPPSAFHSLRWRLPLLVSVLMAAVMALAVWAAYRQVDQTLAQAGSDRAVGAADQLSTLLGSSARLRLDELRRLAADPAVTRYLKNPVDQTDVVVRRRLAAFTRPGRQLFVLSNAQGVPVASLPLPEDAIDMMPASPITPAAGMRLHRAPTEGVIAELTELVADPDRPGGPPLGTLSVRRPVTISPTPDILNRLVGSGAVVLMGPADGGRWTNLSALVPPPPINMDAPGPHEYVATDGVSRIGGLAAIPGTSWRFWVEFPRPMVVAPAGHFLRRMLIVALGLLAMAMVAVAAMAGRLTRPLVQLTRAAERIAGGDYSRRVESTRRDEVGRLTRAFGVMRETVSTSQKQLEADLDERRRMEAALVESERAYRSTFDEAPVGIAHVSLEGAWARVNPRLASMLGYTAADLVARPVATVRSAEDEDREATTRADLLSGAIDRAVRETRYRHRDGRVVRATVTLSLHRDVSNQPQYFIAIIEDISDRRALEEQLVQSQKMEAIGRLAGGVAHDFNNLLTAILGYSNLVLEELEPFHPARADVHEMRKASESAAALTQQLLAFSRKQILQPQVLDLNAAVARADGLLQRLIGEDIALVSRLDSELARISADPGQIEQVILNLAINARDAMPHGGKLTIETSNVELDQSYAAKHPGSSPGAHVMLAVSDTGIGMDEDTLAHVFEPFFTTKQRGEGTGLGLSTVYGIVKQSGGSIWVYSEPGRGTTFKVYFPRVVAGEPVAPVAPRAEGLRGSETILLAEDQPEVRSIGSAVLTRYGYQVLEAANGEQALAIIRSHPGPIHLLLSDVVMPSMNGPELARRVQADHPGIRVLFASGYTDDAIVRHGVLDPGVAFLQKPFTPTALLKKIRELLDAQVST